MVRYFISFLKDRKFRVNINGFITREFSIKTGVPQGAVNSPVLFSIFINDIPTSKKKLTIHSMLFADDLVYYYMYKTNLNDIVSKNINIHLKSIERWLYKWRLRMAPHKCNYIIFNNGKKDISGELNLILNGIRLAHDSSPTFLGIRFDPQLTFKHQIAHLKKTCIQRLSIIKIMSHTSWQLTKETLVQVYNLLIRSVMDYSAILMPVICDTSKKKLQVIQNNALRAILKKPKIIKPKIIDLHTEAKLETLDERFLKLRRRYVQKAIVNNNPVILELIEEYKNFAISEWF